MLQLEVLTSEVPYAAHVFGIALIPFLAFALPMLLSRRLPQQRRALRRKVMIVIALPIFMVCAFVGSFASGSWYKALASETPGMPNASRYPDDFSSLLLRVSIVGGGSFVLIWFTAILIERKKLQNENQE